MALITCPETECGMRFSDQLEQCPECGCPAHLAQPMPSGGPTLDHDRRSPPPVPEAFRREAFSTSIAGQGTPQNRNVPEDPKQTRNWWMNDTQSTPVSADPPSVGDSQSKHTFGQTSIDGTASNSPRTTETKANPPAKGWNYHSIIGIIVVWFCIGFVKGCAGSNPPKGGGPFFIEKWGYAFAQSFNPNSKTTDPQRILKAQTKFARTQQVLWRWDIKYGVFNDDIVLYNASSFAITNAKLHVEIDQGGKRITQVCESPRIEPGQNYTWSNVLSLSSSIPINSKKAHLVCDQNPRSLPTQDLSPFQR